ncbi:MAG: cobyric acid synthase [Lachnospiraceae bacterium]|nr:cobyric acid synthase [Lachnospiraceae bacterium]
MAKVIMIQGTMSNAGKTFLCAGLCRILKQDGYRVAPFKSQNMALNSFITKEGLEMGRAQVMQAEAAGVEPEVAMNPILLKPTSNMGSQVIVNGEVQGNMMAKDYFAHKKKLLPTIQKAYDSLAERYDVIVIEGAGSPAEINLKKDDIVNMGMAKLVDAPVLLVGDIDRGGVFAQLYGTVELLEAEERERIRGLIINKFRGDKSILEPGLAMLEDKCKIPVVGVIPYEKIDVDDEDSLAERLQEEEEELENNKITTVIRIKVIKLPRISNFTDMNALSMMEGVSVFYVEKVSELEGADMIIIPGSKNTISDLLWMRQNGLEATIKKEADKGTLIWGICGGYQMLGRNLLDPLHVESDTTDRIKGMGLLSVDTVMEEEKVRTRIQGRLPQDITGNYGVLSEVPYEGYEIHMGCTRAEKDADISSENRLFSWKRNIFGTYIHGIFDKEEMRTAIYNMIAEQKELPAYGERVMSMEEYKNQQYDLLAENVRENLDMHRIYEIIGLTSSKMREKE